MSDETSAALSLSISVGGLKEPDSSPVEGPWFLEGKGAPRVYPSAVDRRAPICLKPILASASRGLIEIPLRVFCVGVGVGVGRRGECSFKKCNFVRAVFQAGLLSGFLGGLWESRDVGFYVGAFPDKLWDLGRVLASLGFLFFFFFLCVK